MDTLIGTVRQCDLIIGSVLLMNTSIGSVPWDFIIGPVVFMDTLQLDLYCVTVLIFKLKDP